MSLPPLPISLKPIQQFTKLAADHESRDAVVAYYCRMHAFQKGLDLDRTSPEAIAYLNSLMGQLELSKKRLYDEEGIKYEMVGYMLVENQAVKLFNFADKKDRASDFNSSMVKAFCSATLLFDVLANSGKLSEQYLSIQKYAKWKSTYIHKCLKNGETPVPGPVAGMDFVPLEDLNLNDPTEFPGQNPASNHTPALPQVPQYPQQPAGGAPYNPGPRDPGLSVNPNNPYPPSNVSGSQPPTGYPSQPKHQPTPQHQPTSQHQPTPQPRNTTPISNAYTPSKPDLQLSKEQMARAAKLSKFAASALTYEDVNEAISQLTRALNLLTTGSEI